MTQQANVMDAFSQSFNALQGAWDQGTRNRAGRAYAAGDAAGATNALYAGGMISEGVAVENAERTRETADRTQHFAAYLAGASALRQVPQAQRWGIYQQRIAPRLRQMGVPEEELGSITEADMADATLDSLIAMNGGEVQTPFANDRSGPNGSIVRPDRAGVYSEVLPGRETPVPVPTGYRVTTDGNLEAIPGGPADPRVVGVRAAAGRAPPRTRSSRGSNGGASSRTYQPSGIQWD